MDFLPRRENIDNRNFQLITRADILEGASIGGRFGQTQGLQQFGEGEINPTLDANSIVTQRRDLITGDINASINPNLLNDLLTTPDFRPNSGQ